MNHINKAENKAAASNDKAAVALWFIAGIVLFALLIYAGWELFYGVIVPKSAALSALPPLAVLGFAFAAGLASFFAPCPIAVLPAYLSFFLGTSTQEKKTTALKVGLVVSGGVVSFYLVIGIILVALGTSLAFYVNYLKLAVIIIIFLLGISFAMKRQIARGWLDRLNNFFAGKAKAGGRSMKGAYFYGIVYGIGAAACFLPIILTISLFPILDGRFILGFSSFVVYALAISLLLVLATVVTERRQELLFKRFSGAGDKIKRISGVILILTSFYLLSFYVISGM